MAGKIISSTTLRDLIEVLELSQKEFAKLANISESIVSDMLNGKRRISADPALRIKKAFPQVAMPYLVTGSGPMFEDGADKGAHDCGRYKIRIRELEEENMRLKARIFDLEEILKRD